MSAKKHSTIVPVLLAFRWAASTQRWTKFVAHSRLRIVSWQRNRRQAFARDGPANVDDGLTVRMSFGWVVTKPVCPRMIVLW